MEYPDTCISCIMKRKRKIFRRILGSIELPQDLDPHLFFVQWNGGGECLIEQHRGILCFEMNRIRFATEQGTLMLEGESLEMQRLSETRALVRGHIGAVTLEGKS